MNQFYWRGLACTGVAGRDRFRRTKSPPKSPSNLISTAVLCRSAILRGAEINSLAFLVPRWINVELELLANYIPTAWVFRISHRVSLPWARQVSGLSSWITPQCVTLTLGQEKVSATFKDGLEARNLFLPEPACPIHPSQTSKASVGVVYRNFDAFQLAAKRQRRKQTRPKIVNTRSLNSGKKRFKKFLDTP